MYISWSYKNKILLIFMVIIDNLASRSLNMSINCFNIGSDAP